MKYTRQHPVIHLGFPKCASTFLQKQVFPHLKTYEYVGFYNETREMVHKYPHELPADFPISKVAGTRVLISRERLLGMESSHLMFPGHIYNAAMWNIHKFFGTDVTMLAVIRRQDDIVRSRFRHKYGAIMKENLFFLDYPAARRTRWSAWTFKTRGGVYLNSFDYFNRLMPYAELFGKDQIKILVYEDLIYDPGRFFEDMSRALDEDVSMFIDKVDQRENVSKRNMPTANPIVQKLNKHTNGLMSKLLPHREVNISPKFAKELLGHFSESNERLSSFFGLNLERYGYF
jgi:hypothetical protein